MTENWRLCRTDRIAKHSAEYIELAKVHMDTGAHFVCIGLHMAISHWAGLHIDRVIIKCLG